jgi:hypothetical protein
MEKVSVEVRAVLGFVAFLAVCLMPLLGGCRSSSEPTGVPDRPPDYSGVNLGYDAADDQWLVREVGDDCGTWVGRNEATRFYRQTGWTTELIEWGDLSRGRTTSVWYGEEGGDEAAVCPGYALAEVVLEGP